MMHTENQVQLPRHSGDHALFGTFCTSKSLLVVPVIVFRVSLSIIVVWTLVEDVKIVQGPATPSAFACFLWNFFFAALLERDVLDAFFQVSMFEECDSCCNECFYGIVKLHENLACLFFVFFFATKGRPMLFFFPGIEFVLQDVIEQERVIWIVLAASSSHAIVQSIATMKDF